MKFLSLVSLKQIFNRTLVRKVPEITATFWLIKLLTTAMGEALSDYLVFHVNPYFSVIAGFIGFMIALFFQFRLSCFNPWVYWIAAGMVAVFGTMAADVIHVVLGIPYTFSAAMFVFCLVIIFILWEGFEHSLSIHTINTTRREIFYWSAVITTFALGTTLGDLTASTLHLGYLFSGILFGLLIFIPIMLYYQFGLSETFTFWFAYIITRPLGASFADWFGKSISEGGIGFGTGSLSVVLILLIVSTIWFEQKPQKATTKISEINQK